MDTIGKIFWTFSSMCGTQSIHSVGSTLLFASFSFSDTTLLNLMSVEPSHVSDEPIKSRPFDTVEELLTFGEVYHKQAGAYSHFDLEGFLGFGGVVWQFTPAANGECARLNSVAKKSDYLINLLPNNQFELVYCVNGTAHKKCFDSVYAATEMARDHHDTLMQKKSA